MKYITLTVTGPNCDGKHILINADAIIAAYPSSNGTNTNIDVVFGNSVDTFTVLETVDEIGKMLT